MMARPKRERPIECIEEWVRFDWIEYVALRVRNDEEGRAYILQHVEIGHELVVLAKSYILRHLVEDSRGLVEAFLASQDVGTPDQVVIHPTVDSLPALNQACRAFSCRLAAGEAIWGLIHAGVLIQAADPVDIGGTSVGYTTVVPGSGGQSGGWTFPQFSVLVPRLLRLALSQKHNPLRPLSDGDLYLRELEIDGLHAVVDDSLRQAVACFRHDLYTPCLAMLARAVEGAWTEMGLALAAMSRDGKPARAVSLEKDLLDPQYSLARRLTKVGDFYNEKDLCELIWQASRVKPSDLRQVQLWADQVRDARNVLHYQSQPAMANTYEKVAALLIGAIPYFRSIYAIQLACNRLSSSGPN